MEGYRYVRDPQRGLTPLLPAKTEADIHADSDGLIPRCITELFRQIESKKS